MERAFIMSLADRLKQLRELIGKNQKEMAALVGVSYRAWQGYETGENQPGAKVIEETVKLNFNANWLLTGEGTMKMDQGNQPPANYGTQGIVTANGGNIVGIQNENRIETFRYADDVKEIADVLDEHFSRSFRKKLLSELLDKINKNQAS
jgi:transcriptional regulator with XRE-family HTH domain